ncbi:DUF4349 domain-containing protein [Candidatus Woesearchaeota archaeon]|nr:DUF4349 domain-containing protein [Candidatus Woesearchaeota archaeon]
MAIKEQLKKIKDNWLLVVLVLVLLLFSSAGIRLFQAGSSFQAYGKGIPSMAGMAFDEAAEMEYASARVSASGIYPPSEDFSPDVDNRIITKTSSLSTEVKRGTFHEAESRLKTAIESSGSYLLNEDVNRYGTAKRPYYHGSYQIKADTEKYDDLIAKLKEMGEVTFFNENQRDITGQYVNTGIEIETEKARLRRYEEMYEQAEDVPDRIELNDRIFNQERRIKYMEDSLENMDLRVEYSTIFYSMVEKQSEYADIAFIKFSQVIRNLVNSLNSLISLVFVLLPWLIAGLIVLFIVRAVKRKR